VTEHIPESREKIVRHATELFAEKGFDATSMTELAGAAGITKSLIYHYFSGKQELYLAVLSGCSAAFRKKMAECPLPDVGAAARLRGLIEAMIGFYRENRSFCRLLAEATRAGEAEACRIASECVGLAFEGVKECVERGIESGEFREVDPALTAMNVIGSVSSMMAWARVPANGLPEAMPQPVQILDRLPDHFVSILSRHVND